MTEQRENILTDVYSDWLTNGVFKQLEAYDVPWKEDVSGEILDLDYFGNHSGAKLVSPLVHKLLTENGLSIANQAKLAALIFYKYGHAWTRAWDALMKTDYDPLENYHKVEERDPNLTDMRIDNLEYKRTANLTDTRLPNLTETVTDKQRKEEFTPREEYKEVTKSKNHQTTNNSLYGFNSADPVPSDKSDTSGKMEDNEDEKIITNRGKDTREFNGSQDKTTKGSDVNKKTGDDTYNTTGSQTYVHYGKDKTTTSGNIGVTTNQQMLESEMELRFKWNFFESIFKDVDNILTVNIYGRPLDYFIYD